MNSTITINTNTKLIGLTMFLIMSSTGEKEQKLSEQQNIIKQN
jgi:hypothetical protein